MRNWRAIVFDMDDTLYPERDYVMSGFRAVSYWAETHMGITSDTGFLELQSLYDRGVRGDTFDRWLTLHNTDGKTWVPRLIQIYREHEPAIKPFPEVPGLLSDLKTHYLLGLLSDGYLDVQRRKLKALKLAEWFHAIAFSDEWGRDAWKPSTKPFEEILRRLGDLPAKDAIYVADNPAKDFLAARKSGLLSVEVRRFHGVYSRVDAPTPEHRPNFVIPSLNGLPAALLQLQTDS